MDGNALSHISDYPTLIFKVVFKSLIITHMLIREGHKDAGVYQSGNSKLSQVALY